MPGRYGRRYTKRRKFVRGRKPYGRRGLRGQVRRIARKVRNIGKAIETKQFTQPLTNIQGGDVTNGTTPWSSGDTGNPYWYIPAMIEGTDESDREAHQVRATSLELHFRVRMNTGSYGYPFNVRCILFRDKYAGPNVPAPNLGEILDDTSQDEKVAANLNWENRKRFDIIRDKTYGMSPNFLDTGSISQWRSPIGRSFLNKKWHIKLNKQINFIGSTADYGSAGRGAIYFIVVNDCTTSTAANLAVVQAGWRLKFQG